MGQTAMMEPPEFFFERSRGIVWVCDVESSSAYLNADGSAGALEMFLPRLHWIASVFVEAAGGTFIKWTGDGFLAWFPAQLHRDIGDRASDALTALYHLTVFTNVTQLGVDANPKFRLRHGVTAEHDALLTKIVRAGKLDSLDVMGRAVVLAFRLSGMKAKFPGVTISSDVHDAYSSISGGTIHFKKWLVSSEDRLKYFKGEKWGTSHLYRASDKPSRKKSRQTVIRQAEKAIALAETPTKTRGKVHAMWDRIDSALRQGPDWSHQAMADYLGFIKTELLGGLKAATELLRDESGPKPS